MATCLLIDNSLTTENTFENMSRHYHMCTAVHTMTHQIWQPKESLADIVQKP